METTRWRFQGGRIEVDFTARTVTQDGAPTSLGGRGLDLLAALLARRDQVATKEDLLQAAWPGLVVEENNLQVQVSALRKVFGAQAIVNVRGRGYCWTLAPDVPAAQRLIGREALQADLARRLQQPGTQLLTLHGSGGVGKTRLAESLLATASGFADGRWSVELAPLRDPALVPDALLQALGLQPQSAHPPEALLREYLRDRECLLLLDNVEHVRDAAPVLARLLDAAPRLKLLVTSRVALGLPHESLCLVPPLETIAQGDEPPAALRLFIQRASELGVDLASRPEELAAAALICRRLDGLPLALELAAARLRVLTARALLDELQQPLSLVGAGADAAPTRQRSLRDTLAWSERLLGPGARSLLAELGCFSGSFDIESALAVSDAPDKATLLDRLTALLDHHLLARHVGDQGQVRFTMLEMIREYALERLAASGQADAVAARHARCFGDLARRLDVELRSPRRAAAMARLQQELANLRAALAHLIHHQRDAVAALRLVGNLSWAWYFSGSLLEGRRWQDEALSLALDPGADAAVWQQHRLHRARTLSGAAKLCLYLSDPMQAIAFGEQAVALAREAGDGETLAYALYHLAIPTQVQSPERAVALHDEARALFRAARDAWGEALCTVYGGIPLSFSPAHQAAAQVRLGDGRQRFLALGDPWGSSVGDQYLGLMALRRGDLEQAQAHADEVMRVAVEADDGYRIALSHQQMGRIALAGGRHDLAAAHYVQAVKINARQGRLGYATHLLLPMARLAARRGGHRLAARLFGAASVDRGPVLRQLFLPDELAACDEAREKLREQIGSAAFAKLAAEGSSWTLAQALDAATPRSA